MLRADVAPAVEGLGSIEASLLGTPIAMHFDYYIEKTAYSLSNAQKQQKLNVINYKHETNALAYTFKAGNWQI